MIELSELAATALVEALEASGVIPGQCLRLEEEGSQFKLQLDRPGEHDRVIRHNGVMVIIVADDVEAKIGNALIDIENGSDESYLAIHCSALQQRREWPYRLDERSD
jgi:hypothetical protein